MTKSYPVSHLIHVSFIWYNFTYIFEGFEYLLHGAQYFLRS